MLKGERGNGVLEEARVAEVAEQRGVCLVRAAAAGCRDGQTWAAPHPALIMQQSEPTCLAVPAWPGPLPAAWMT